MSDTHAEHQLHDWYFTFGSNHQLPDGSNGLDQYVVVTCPADVDERAVFMGWLGSNKWSMQYNQRDWEQNTAKYYSGPPNTTILVVPRNPLAAEDLESVCQLPNRGCDEQVRPDDGDSDE